MANEPDEKQVTGLNPNALSLTNAARLLSNVGGERITEEMIHQDVEAGAPLNPDGTINLVRHG